MGTRKKRIGGIRRALAWAFAVAVLAGGTAAGEEALFGEWLGENIRMGDETATVRFRFNPDMTVNADTKSRKVTASEVYRFLVRDGVLYLYDLDGEFDEFTALEVDYELDGGELRLLLSDSAPVVLARVGSATPRSTSPQPRKSPPPPQPQLQPPQAREPAPQSSGGGFGDRDDGDPGLRGERAVWLMDPVMGMYFAAVVVPDGWMADGKVVWDFPNRANPHAIHFLFSNPGEGKSIGMAAQLGSFTWSEQKASVFKIGDGAFMVDTGIVNRRYRNAEAVLREFIAPALRNAVPGASVAHIKSLPASEAAEATQRANALAEIKRRGGRQVTGAEGTAAEMAIDYTTPGGIAMRDVVIVSVAAVSSPEMGGTVDWEWVGMLIMSAPKGREISLDEIKRVATDIRINQDWRNKADAEVAALRRQGMEVSIQAQREASRYMRQTMERAAVSAEKFRREVIDQNKLYVDPRTGEEIVVPASKYAVRDSISNRVILSDVELNPNVLGGNYGHLAPIDD